MNTVYHICEIVTQVWTNTAAGVLIFLLILFLVAMVKVELRKYQ